MVASSSEGCAMAKSSKDHDERKPPEPRSRRSAVEDVTDKLPQLPQLGDDDEGPEVTVTEPRGGRSERSATGLRPAPPPPAPPPPPRKPTPAASPVPPVPLSKASPKPTRQLIEALGDEDEAEATMVVDQLAQHWAGPKAGLKPVYEAVLEAARRLGKINVVPGPVCVVLSRQREFAILQATPQGDRVELGLVLPGRPPSRRLNRARHFDWGERFTHYVTLRYKTDVDSDVRSWLTDACWSGG